MTLWKSLNGDNVIILGPKKTVNGTYKSYYNKRLITLTKITLCFEKNGFTFVRSEFLSSSDRNGRSGCNRFVEDLRFREESLAAPIRWDKTLKYFLLLFLENKMLN
jgi:hypothetical protein